MAVVPDAGSDATGATWGGCGWAGGFGTLVAAAGAVVGTLVGAVVETTLGMIVAVASTGAGATAVAGCSVGASVAAGGSVATGADVAAIVVAVARILVAIGADG